MKTIVLDDDPTGTQSATGVTVLFETDADLLTRALLQADSVYVQTNSRALSEENAVCLVKKIKADGEAAAQQSGRGGPLRPARRFDAPRPRFRRIGGLLSTRTPSCSSFPPSRKAAEPRAAGSTTSASGISTSRPTRANTPRIRCSASRPGVLRDYVAEKSGRLGIPVPLEKVRAGELAQILAEAPAGAVVLPDVVNAGDVSAIARAVDEVTAGGRRVVVRCAAPLAAELAGVPSSGLLPSPLVDRPKRVLLVCGSHTLGASAQLAPIAEAWGAPAVVDTATALDAPTAAGLEAADAARLAFAGKPVVLVATERDRAAEHNTLDHGERVMAALTTAVRLAAAGRRRRRRQGRNHLGRGRAHRYWRDVGVCAWTGSSGCLGMAHVRPRRPRSALHRRPRERRWAGHPDSSPCRSRRPRDDLLSGAAPDVAPILTSVAALRVARARRSRRAASGLPVSAQSMSQPSCLAAFRTSSTRRRPRA